VKEFVCVELNVTPDVYLVLLVYVMSNYTSVHYTVGARTLQIFGVS